MSIIYCGKANKTPYYIKEADLNIYSIQQLAYFIFNYAMLISNNFITKNLIIYIDKMLEIKDLASRLNDMYNTRASLADMLTLILEYSNYYDDNEIIRFKERLLKLISKDENDYINLAGDKLFYLKKYERAISQYNKIAKTNNDALLKLAYCYAKLQFYDTASFHLKELYQRTKSMSVLKDIYYCLKLNGNVDEIYEIESNVSEEVLADWEFDIVSTIITARKSDELKEKESIFLMGSTYIRQSVSLLIKIWKEKYRYIG